MANTAFRVAGVDQIFIPDATTSNSGLMTAAQVTTLNAAGKTGNWTFTNNNADLSAAGAMGIGNIGPTATSIVFGPSALTLAANTTMTAAASATNTTGLTITSNVADGATSIGLLINNTTSLAAAGSLLLAVQNAGANKWTLDPTGKQTIFSDIVVGAGSPKAGSLANPMGTLFTPTIDSGTGNALSLTGRQPNTADPIGNATGAVGISTLSLTAIGMKALSFSTSNNFGIGVTTGDGTFSGLYSRQMTADASGTTINKLVVFSGALKVQIPAATGNLKTVAGVALGTRTSGQAVSIMSLGPCLVSADAGIAAGDLLVSSSAVAGNVMTNNTAAAGTIVGRAMEATGGTVAGQVYVDLGKN